MKNFGWVIGALLLGCGGSSTEATPSGGNNTPVTTNGDAGSATATCSETAGATWSLEKSRFAFGGTPVEDQPGHWTGPTGAGGVSDGFAMFSLNGDSPDRGRPDFTADSEALQKHVKEYLMGFGIQECQIGQVQVFGSGGGGGRVGGPSTFTGGSRTIVLERAIAGISVPASNASARLDDQDESTSESFTWPEVPTDVVAQAKAFRDELATPAAVAAYKAKLPENSRNEGSVIIFHTARIGSEPLRFAAAWSTQTDGGRFGAGSPVTFDRDGKALQPF